MNSFRSLGVYLMALTSLFAAGCGNTLPPPADPEVAKAMLRAALDAWKNGETSESLKSRKPPVYFNEPGCVEGNRLGNYVILSEEPSGLSYRAVVGLTMETDDGETIDRTARYAVDTSPAIVIVREP